MAEKVKLEDKKVIMFKDERGQLWKCVKLFKIDKPIPANTPIFVTRLNNDYKIIFGIKKDN